LALSMTILLWLAPAPGAGWRLLAGLIAAALGWRPLRGVIFQRGPAAVRRFEWARNGDWSIQDRNGTQLQVRLDAATAALGPWVLLVWTGAPGAVVRGRRYALVDAASVSPWAFRALRGRLKLAAWRANPRDPHDNC
jgi:hypothetical protein